MPGNSSRRSTIDPQAATETPDTALDRLARRPFAASAAAALALHATLLFANSGLAGGADLGPHLRLIQQMAEKPGIHNVYPPALHVFGALFGFFGPSLAVEFFSLGAVALLLLGFRAFQRASGLPEICSALFAWAPYGFALSWCLPKVEAAGYGLAFAGLAALLRQRPLAAALALGAAFHVHTAAALFLGLCGGITCLERRDPRGLVALAGGTLLALPLVGSHLAAGCSLAQALLFSEGDYLRRGGAWNSLDHGATIALLAGPLAIAVGAAGLRPLWRHHRSAAWLALVVSVLCTNELWLAPFGVQTTLNLLRGLTLLAFPIAAAAGVAVARSPRRGLALLALCITTGLLTTRYVLPDSCHRVPVDFERVDRMVVDRCTFRWAFRRTP